MSVLRRTVVALPAAVALLAAIPNAAFAKAAVAKAAIAKAAIAAPDQPLFVWSGTVDREVFIVVRGRDVNTQGRDANLPNRVRVANAMPRSFGELRVNVEEGRGNIGVIEQPSARNGYQAVIRIQDPSGGADRYRLAVYWDGDNRNGNGDANSGRGRGRDDDWNPGRGKDCDDDRKARRGKDRDEDRKSGRGKDCDDDRKSGRGRDRDDDDRNSGRDRDDDRDDDRGRGSDDRNSEHGALKWSGRVDDLVEIRIQGRRIEYITRSGARLANVNSDIDGNGLPRRMVDVQLVRRDGRGEIEVVQQPNPRNDFTAVIRVYDPRGGAANYDFVARW